MSVTLSQVRTAVGDRPQIWPPPSTEPEIIGLGDGVATVFSLQFENWIPGTLTVYEAPSPQSGQSTQFTAVSNAPSVAVATTSSTAVTSAGVPTTITPVSMTNIVVGVYLLVDVPGNQEIVKVTAVTGSTFTATFALAHLTGFAIAGAPAYIVGAPNAGTNATAATNAIVTFAAPPAAGSLIAARYQATAFSDADLQGYLTRALTVYSDDLTVIKRVQYDLIDAILMDQRRLEMFSEGDAHKDRAAFVSGLHALKQELRVDLEGGPQPGTNLPAISINGVATAPRYETWR